MNAIQAFVPAAVVETFAAFLEFCYIARRNIITEDSLEQLNVALHKFHEARQIFSGTVREDGPSGFSLPRQHAMVHYYDHIKNFGSPNGLCSSITESKHIAAVKRPWRRSNKHNALSQMLKINERLDKLAAARADFKARGMLDNSCLIQAIMDTAHDTGDPMDEDASDSDETDSNTSDEVSIYDSDHADTRRLDNAGATTPDDANADADIDADASADADADALNETNTHILDADHDRFRLPSSRSPTPPEEEDDHGPVESGPLMNEVRLAHKRGKESLPRKICFSNVIHSIHTGISQISWCTRLENRPTQSPRSYPPFPLLSTQPLVDH
jgi:hypothetical protein